MRAITNFYHTLRELTSASSAAESKEVERLADLATRAPATAEKIVAVTSGLQSLKNAGCAGKDLAAAAMNLATYCIDENHVAAICDAAPDFGMQGNDLYNEIFFFQK